MKQSDNVHDFAIRGVGFDWLVSACQKRTLVFRYQKVTLGNSARLDVVALSSGQDTIPRPVQRPAREVEHEPIGKAASRKICP